MNLVFSDHARDDYLYWQQHDRNILKRIHELIREIRRTRFAVPVSLSR